MGAMSSAPKSPQRRRIRRNAGARGFTLVEVLIATVLLAAGLTLAFATLGGASKAAQRGEAIASHSERIRAVENFLRRRLEAVRPVPFNFDQTQGTAQRFLGERDRIRFVADLPDYLGRGGPYLHDVAIVEGRLEVGFTMVLAGDLVEEAQPRPPEPLVDVAEARFRYRGLNPEGRLGEWLERWETPDRLPLQVEVVLRDAEGRAWPTMVIALPLAGSHSGVGELL